MDVTEQLLRVFTVEQQLRGLESRLKSAEKYLTQQDSELKQLEQRKSDLSTQLKQAQAAAANFEGEMKVLDGKMETTRGYMENAQTNKEYQAFNVQLNTLKVDRDNLEAKALESMSKVDAIKTQLAGIDAQQAEGLQKRTVATGDRDKRADEIKDRVEQLRAQRAAAVVDVPKDALKILEDLLRVRGEGAMAAVEVHDPKRHEYSCGGCTMFLPVESVSGLMAGGRLTKCVSCGCILYLDEEFRKAIEPPKKGKGKKSEAAEQF